MPTIKYYQEKLLGKDPEKRDKKKKEIEKGPEIYKDVQRLFSAHGPDPKFNLGEVFIISPENTGMVMDFTSKMGACSNAYYSFIFQVMKWNYRIAKVDENMAVSPVHAEAYNLLVGQKQKLETQIRQGLTQTAQAVVDYELLAHDERRYREIIDYFKKGAKDDHVLRALFVDRVDAFTGEGYSMITMAKRWPTIINDFIRMGKIASDQKKNGKEHPLSATEDIEKLLDVPLAEATILKTKNELFTEWKELFKPVVMERYARIKTMADARKESIKQYKNWLKPYIVRHKAMKESEDKRASTDFFNAPAFGTGVAATSVRLWAWRPFSVEEKRKPEMVKVVGEKHGFVIDPLDEWAKKWIAKINIKYGTCYDENKMTKMLDEFTSVPLMEKEVPGSWMSKNDLYYMFFDVMVERSIIKTPPPAGGEIEDLMLNPLRCWVMSQNALFVHLVELKAIEDQFEREMNILIGTQEFEEETLERVREEMDIAEGKPKKDDKKNGEPEFVKSMRKPFDWLREHTKPYAKYFFRGGPYENTFDERVTKLYLVGVGTYFTQMCEFWKSKFNVK